MKLHRTSFLTTALRRLGPGRVALAATLWAVSPPSSVAQGTAPNAFEAASVKANRSGEVRVFLQPQPSGRFSATNIPLRALIRYAYRIQDFQLEGGPDWPSTDRFDVVATAGAPINDDEMRRLVQGLLSERFLLQVRREAKEQPIYVLAVERRDGRLGPGLRQSAATCASAGLTPGPFNPNAPCGYFGPTPGVPITQARMTFSGLTIETFARALTPMVRRSVIDRTGLVGYFDGEFGATAELPPPPPPPGLPDPRGLENLPSIFTELREQLGLKLESSRGQVEVVVIEKVEALKPD